MMPAPPPTRRSSSAPDITVDKPDEIPPDPRRYLLFCSDENRCMLKALLRVNDVCYDRPQVWTALGDAHDAISGDMLHAQEKSFQRGGLARQVAAQSAVRQRGLSADEGQGALMVGGLYTAASVLCEVNTLEDIQTSIMVSSAETPVLLLGAAVLGYGMKSYGPPLLAVPGAAIGGALIVGSTMSAWEHVGGFLGLHNHTDDQKRKHIAGLTLAGAVCAVAGTAVNTLAGAVCAVAGTAVNTLSVVGQVPSCLWGLSSQVIRTCFPSRVKSKGTACR